MKRITVKSLAVEAGLDVDEALIELWDAGFGYINSPGDVLARGEANRARRILGLATRRERAATEYWEQVLECDRTSLIALLAELGVPRPFSGGKLSKKAQHRLSAAARERGVVKLTTDKVVEAPKKPVEPFEWVLVGHERTCHSLTAEQVETIHNELVANFATSRDPISPPGIKSAILLESAVHRPETASGDVHKYPTVELSAAALLHALVHNHAFHNGNKRTALVSMLVFIDDNGFVLTASEDELFKLVLLLGQHALVESDRQELPDREVWAVANWLKQRVRWKEEGDRPIPWRLLRPILTSFGCQCERASRGQRLTVTRRVKRAPSGLLRRARTETLSASISGVLDGRDVDRHVVSRLREDLELNDVNGVDSAAFYNDAPLSPSDFIRFYQGLLRRLAKL